MKQFYTLLTLALTTLSAGATDPMAMAVNPLGDTEFTVFDIDRTHASVHAVQSPVMSRSQAFENASQTDGRYLWQGYGAVQGQQTDGIEPLWYFTSKAEGNKITMGEFIYQDTYFTVDFDAATQSITFPKGCRATCTLSTGGKVDLTFYEYDFDTKTAGPLTLQYSEAYHAWCYEAPYDNSYQYSKAMVYALADSPVGYGVQAVLYVSRFHMINGQLAHLGQYNDKTGKFENPEFFDVYIEKPSENTLTIDNMFGLGFGYNAAFEIDNNKKMIKGNEPIIGQNSSGGPICFYGVDSDGYGTPLSEFSYREDTSTGDIQHLLICNFGAAVDILYNEGTRYNGVQVLCPFNPFNGAGVGSLTEDNADAPAEYYNLQGVRVTNPENGLYIRRQGTKVSKVLIK